MNTSTHPSNFGKRAPVKSSSLDSIHTHDVEVTVPSQLFYPYATNNAVTFTHPQQETYSTLPPSHDNLLLDPTPYRDQYNMLVNYDNIPYVDSGSSSPNDYWTDIQSSPYIDQYMHSAHVMSNQINDNDSTNRRSSRSYGKKRKSDSPYSTIKQSSSQTKTYPPTPTKERKHRKQPHELLTDSQKKANHIASEQKRRQNIRIGFDQLIDIVPSLNHGNRSEALILQKSVDHIRHLISIKSSLKNQVRDLHGTLGDDNYEDDSSEDELQYSY